MYARIVLTALAGGLVAGVFLWGAHMTLTSPVIAAAEFFKSRVVGSVRCVSYTGHKPPKKLVV